jgi:tetratricopeptide (TPR) repeat protein
MKRILPVIFCLAILGCEEQRKGQFLEQGIVFFDQGSYKEAELEIKSAIQEDPSASEPYYYMALLNEKAKKYKAMKANLLETVKLDPEKTKARLKLGKVFLLFNEIDNASKEIESVLVKNPEQLDALSIKASILVRQKKIEDALIIIDDILTKDPDHIEAISLKVVVLMREKMLDQAVAILMPAIQKNSENVSLHLLKIQLDSQLNDVDAVVKDYERLAELKPDSLQVKFTLAKVYQKANIPQKAENVLKLMIDENPKLMNVKIALLNFIIATDEEKAMSQFDLFAENYKDDSEKLAVLANWLVSKNKTGKARDILGSALANNDIDDQHKASLNLLLAKMDIATKKYTEALVHIDSALKENIDNTDAKVLKAGIQIALGQYDDARKLLKDILWQRPNMDQALSLLGGINEIQGDLDEAAGNYGNALKINPKNMQALNFIVSKEVAEGHADYAIEILERALRLAPSQLVILTKLVELKGNEQKWDDAKQYINRIQIQKNGVLLAGYLKGNVLQKQKKYQEAILIYKALLEKAPWIKDALIGMAECYSQLNQQSKMREYLDGLIGRHPKMSFPYILKSQLLSADRKYNEAISFISGVLKKHDVKDVSIYLELGRLYSITGDMKSEQQTYLDGLKVLPDNIALMQRLASGYEKVQLFDKAVDLYEKILLINPQDNASKNNLATLFLDHYGQPEDIKKAVHIVESFKQAKQPYFLDTYGWAKLKSGELEDALSIFKQVIMLQPDVPVFRYHLAVAYNNLGDSLSASSELKQALYIGKGKDFPEKALIEKLLAKIKNR